MTAPLKQRCLIGSRRALRRDGVGRATRAFGAMLLVGALLGSGGCGPFGYLKKVAVDASRAVGQAEKAGAKEFAPYEYWGAVTYLDQAKVMMAYSEYDRAFDYGDRARQLADEAKKKAARREAGKMRETESDKASADEKDSAGKASGAGAPDGGGSVGGQVGGKVGGGK